MIGLVGSGLMLVTALVALPADPDSGVATDGARVAPPPSIGYPDLYAQLDALAPDPTRIAQVSDLVLTREAGTFSLGAGELALLSPVGGRTVAAVYVGAGVFRGDPPTTVERSEVRRLLEVDSLVRPFTALFLVFTDSTLAELDSRLTFAPGAAPDDADDVIEHALDYLRDDDAEAFDVHLAEALLHEDPGHFYAHFYERSRDFLVYRVDPYAIEEVQIFKRGEGRGRGDELDLVCSFHWEADRAGGAATDEPKERVRIGGYAIEHWIEGNLHYAASATFDITAVVPAVRWVPLNLFYELEVDSARWADGTPAVVVQGDESSDVWLAAAPSLARDSPRTVTFYYHGSLMARQRDLMFIKSPSNWFPRHDGDLRATFDLTFHTPERYEIDIVAVGDLVHEEVRDRTHTTRWVTSGPIDHAGFNLGRFEEFSMQFRNLPRFTVMMSPDAHRSLNTVYLTGVGMMEDVTRDVGSSLAYFTELFGPLEVPQLYATEIPFSHGQAFPGLIHLSILTFLEEEDEVNWNELFRAHEVAHQWWGVGVDWRTYRDQWLSEGFAEFSALWYVETGLNAREEAEEMLEEWREDIFDEWEKLGPIDIGRRSLWEGDYRYYDLVVYKKGAWVLHMLRMLLRDPTTGSDDRFTALLRDFYTTFLGRSATTADFRQIAERHAGMDLGWFFRQWVEGTALPTYRFATQIEENEAGQFIVRLRVAQEDVPPDFQMPVPVLFDLGEGREAIAPLLVTGPVTEVELPPFSVRPEAIVLNPHESVLAKVETEDWPES
ncbi:MAG: M1 family aminopeptidase [Gemmatimonadales bacterium]